VYEFLGRVQEQFRNKLGKCSVSDLMFVKEDVILPHNISFHDLIITRARGKSGPLFNWDVHEDIRCGSFSFSLKK
jgi:protein FAM50